MTSQDRLRTRGSSKEKEIPSPVAAGEGRDNTLREAVVMAHDSRHDWGSVTEIERGKRYRLRWWANGPDGYRRHSETVRGTRREAWDRLAALRLDHSTDAPVPTVGECWRRWYEPDLVRQVEMGDLSRRTLEEYRAAWRVQVSSVWADVPADQVRPLAVSSGSRALPTTPPGWPSSSCGGPWPTPCATS